MRGHRFTVRDAVSIGEVIRILCHVIEAEKPVLRYQVPGMLFKTPIIDVINDQTGEKLVEWNMKVLTGKITK